VSIGANAAGAGADIWLVAFDPGPVIVVVGSGVNVNRSVSHYNLVDRIWRVSAWNGEATWFERYHCSPECAVLVQRPGGQILSAIIPALAQAGSSVDIGALIGQFAGRVDRDAELGGIPALDHPAQSLPGTPSALGFDLFKPRYRAASGSLIKLGTGTFTLSGGTVSGSIQGGGGMDTLL
jgi:hypothetical protein